MSSNSSREDSSRPDQRYFAARAEAERRLAGQASDQRVRSIHEQLAAEYDARARDGVAND